MLKKLIISLTFVCTPVSFAGKTCSLISNETTAPVTIELTNNTGMPLFLIASSQASVEDGCLIQRIRTIRDGENYVKLEKRGSLKNHLPASDRILLGLDSDHLIITPGELPDTSRPAEFSRIPTITTAIPSKNTCYTVELINGRLVLEEVA